MKNAFPKKIVPNIPVLASVYLMRPFLPCQIFCFTMVFNFKVEKLKNLTRNIWKFMARW
jgi:hypothetical protein